MVRNSFKSYWYWLAISTGSRWYTRYKGRHWWCWEPCKWHILDGDNVGDVTLPLFPLFIQGPTGPQGSIGFAGPQGSLGAPGEPGQQGSKGPAVSSIRHCLKFIVVIVHVTWLLEPWFTFIMPCVMVLDLHTEQVSCALNASPFSYTHIHMERN